MSVWRKIEDAIAAKRTLALSHTELVELVALDAARTESKNDLVRANWRYKRIARAVHGERDADAESRRENFTRASGDCVCDLCGNLFFDHPFDPCEPSLIVLCDLSRVKL